MGRLCCCTVLHTYMSWHMRPHHHQHHHHHSTHSQRVYMRSSCSLVYAAVAHRLECLLSNNSNTDKIPVCHELVIHSATTSTTTMVIMELLQSVCMEFRTKILSATQKWSSPETIDGRPVWVAMRVCRVEGEGSEGGWGRCGVYTLCVWAQCLCATCVRMLCVWWIRVILTNTLWNEWKEWMNML